jgi:WD40 repeat protein
MNTIKTYLLSLSMIIAINSPLLATRNPASLRDLTTNTLIKTVLNHSLGESLSQVMPDKVPGDVIQFLRQTLIQRYRVLLLNIINSCLSTVLIGHTNSVESIAFSPDGKFALTGSKDFTARLWDIEDINNIQPYILNGHTAGVTSVAFSPDGKFALTGSWDHTARLWDIQDINNIHSYILNGHIHWVISVAFSPDGKFALTRSFDKIACLWDIQDKDNIQSYVLNNDWVVSAAFSPDGQYVLTGSEQTTACLWNIQDINNIQPCILNNGHTQMVSSVALSPDGKFALTGSFDNTVRLWHIQDKGNIHSHVLNNIASLGAFSPDGKYVLTNSTRDNTARLQDIQDINTRSYILDGRVNNFRSYLLNGHTDRVTSGAFSPDGNYALTQSQDGTARLWDIQDINNIQSYILNDPRGILSATFSPDSKYVLTGSSNNTARLWNLVEPLISMESLTLQMILLIIKLDQNAHNNNQILTQNHYSETFNACDDLQLKQAIMTYFKLEPITASSSNSN